VVCLVVGTCGPPYLCNDRAFGALSCCCQRSLPLQLSRLQRSLFALYPAAAAATPQTDRQTDHATCIAISRMFCFAQQCDRLIIIYYFASAAVTVDSSHMTASWSRFSPPSNSVNCHLSTMWFMVCRWPQWFNNNR